MLASNKVGFMPTIGYKLKIKNKNKKCFCLFCNLKKKTPKKPKQTKTTSMFLATACGFAL